MNTAVLTEYLGLDPFMHLPVYVMRCDNDDHVTWRIAVSFANDYYLFFIPGIPPSWTIQGNSYPDSEKAKKYWQDYCKIATPNKPMPNVVNKCEVPKEQSAFKKKPPSSPEAVAAFRLYKTNCGIKSFRLVEYLGKDPVTQLPTYVMESQDYSGSKHWQIVLHKDGDFLWLDPNCDKWVASASNWSLHEEKVRGWWTNHVANNLVPVKIESKTQAVKEEPKVIFDKPTISSHLDVNMSVFLDTYVRDGEIIHQYLRGSGWCINLEKSLAPEKLRGLSHALADSTNSIHVLHKGVLLNQSPKREQRIFKENDSSISLASPITRLYLDLAAEDLEKALESTKEKTKPPIQEQVVQEPVKSPDEIVVESFVDWGKDVKLKTVIKDGKVTQTLISNHWNVSLGKGLMPEDLRFLAIELEEPMKEGSKITSISQTLRRDKFVFLFSPFKDRHVGKQTLQIGGHETNLTVPNQITPHDLRLAADDLEQAMKPKKPAIETVSTKEEVKQQVVQSLWSSNIVTM